MLHRFWLLPLLTDQHVDLISFWLPRWCYLGKSIAAGHVPTWLPNQFGGVPFASDPQSGWLYLPPMLLFSLFSCARALGLFIVLQPILAGLGLYLFLRKEGLRRAAATVAGVALSLAMSGSFVAIAVHLAGPLAWTCLSLAGMAGYLHSKSGSATTAWLGFTAFSWSQVAAAHLTDGVLVATALMALYFAARGALQVRSGERTGASVVLLATGLTLALPLLAAAVFLPRLALIPRTSVGHGYLELVRIASRLSDAPTPPVLYERGTGVWWGTSFARGAAGYVGAAAILLVPAAFSSRRWRLPASAFALAALGGYLLNLDRLVAAGPVRDLALRSGIGELWLRSPERFKYVVLLAFAALAGYGLQAWLEMARVVGWRQAARRSLWLLPSLVVFVALPLAAGSRAVSYIPFAIGFAYSLPLLLAAAQDVRWAGVALPLLLAVELTVTGLVSQFGPPSPPPVDRFPPPVNPGLGTSFPKLHPPSIRPEDYLTPGPIGTRLVREREEHGRYLTFDPEVVRENLRGFLFRQGRPNWGAYENGRSILFDLSEVQGYSPIQLDRYWRLVRKHAPYPVFYNAATITSLRPALLRLFGVRWLVLPSELGDGPLRVAPPGADGETPEPRGPLSREGRYSLYQVADPDPRASVVFRWRVLSPRSALTAVLQPGFDPSEEAILESEPHLEHAGPPPHRATGTVDEYTEPTEESVRARITATAPGLLVVRNAYDRNWRAEVDGRPAPVLVADYMMQAVPVPAGSHTVTLAYCDDIIGIGAAISAAAWLLLLVLGAWQWRRGGTASRASRTREPGTSPSPSP